MKIIFNTKELIEKVKNIAPTAEAKQTLIILGNMIIKVESRKAYFTASDLGNVILILKRGPECTIDGGRI